ncbi:MAG TPA: glycosyltransferase family 2 protein [bacterium]|nr:glycosyltransferase family 2 protein [bacterium]
MFIKFMENMQEKKQLSVVIPVFNEQNAVVSVITEINSLLSKLSIDYEIIAVNDGSTDKSKQAIESLNLKKLRIINHPYNRGYGAALKTGIKKAIYEYICIIDADNTYPVEAIKDMLNSIPEYDMVVGARIGVNVDIPFTRKFAKIFITKLANYLVGIEIVDLNSGLRIFKKNAALLYLNILPNGFSFTTTITCAMMSSEYFVKFHPIDYYKRTGQSKIKPFHAVEFLLLVTRLIIYFKPLKIFIPISALFFIVGFIRAIFTVFRDFAIHQLSMILIISALMFFLIGLIADMLVKTRNIPS